MAKKLTRKPAVMVAGITGGRAKGQSRQPAKKFRIPRPEARLTSQ